MFTSKPAFNQQETEPKTSKYNSGIAQIYRLDGLWKEANKNSVEGLYYKWNLSLDVIWRELARDLQEETYVKKKKSFNVFEEELGESGTFLDGGKDGWKKMVAEDIKKRNQQYKILMEKELFLRRLENSLGKGTAWDVDEDDWE